MSLPWYQHCARILSKYIIRFQRYICCMYIHSPGWSRSSLIVRFMGPTWGPAGADRTQVGPMLPHEPCCLVSIRACTRSIINDFKDELKSEIPKLILDNNRMTDPNLSYQAFEDFVLRIKEKNMPMKTVRFDKYKHKMTKWVTTGIIKSIKFRDNYIDSWKVARWTAKNIIPWKLIWKHTTLYFKKYQES